MCGGNIGANVPAINPCPDNCRYVFSTTGGALRTASTFCATLSARSKSGRRSFTRSSVMPSSYNRMPGLPVYCLLNAARTVAYRPPLSAASVVDTAHTRSAQSHEVAPASPSMGASRNSDNTPHQRPLGATRCISDRTSSLPASRKSPHAVRGRDRRQSF